MRLRNSWDGLAVNLTQGHNTQESSEFLFYSSTPYHLAYLLSRSFCSRPSMSLRNSWDGFVVNFTQGHNTQTLYFYSALTSLPLSLPFIEIFLQQTINETEKLMGWLCCESYSRTQHTGEVRIPFLLFNTPTPQLTFYRDLSAADHQ